MISPTKLNPKKENIRVTLVVPVIKMDPERLKRIRAGILANALASGIIR